MDDSLLSACRSSLSLMGFCLRDAFMMTCCASAVDPARAPLPTRAVRPFAAARVFTHQQGLPTRAAWRAWARTSARPVDIPMRPDVVYKGCGWCSWHDWLGTTRPSRTWRPFPEARAHAQSLHLAGARAWRAWSQTGARPCDIPSNLNKAYRDAGWQSWGDWLGTDRRAVARSVLLPFDEARAYARRLGLSSQQAWADWVKTDARPAGIPAHPARTYRDEGWAGFRDWLGRPGAGRIQQQ